MTLLEQFEQEFEKRKFSPVEIMGFVTNPKLAVIAGMAIGYLMAIDAIDGEISPESISHKHSTPGGPDPSCTNSNQSARDVSSS